MKKLGEAFFLLLIATPLSIWRAWCLSVVWRWFVTPVFGIGAPSIAAILGLVLFAQMVCFRFDWKEHTLPEKAGRLIASMGFAPLLGLGFAAIYHAFM